MHDELTMQRRRGVGCEMRCSFLSQTMKQSSSSKMLLVVLVSLAIFHACMLLVIPSSQYLILVLVLCGVMYYVMCYVLCIVCSVMGWGVVSSSY